MSIDRLHMELGDRGYDILIGSGLLDQTGALMAPVMRGKRAFVVTDDQVGPVYLDRVLASLDKAGIAHDHTQITHGEHSKDFAHLEALVESMLDARCERSTMIIALGGGVVGDLTGFAAAILQRGVDFVQIPTTLLAQVDSSVGGKTGINTKKGKNLVGAFHQPRLVLADISVLDTLPRRQVLAGYAEVVKYGCIDDADFFTWLEANGDKVIDGDVAARRYAVAISCRAKARIVAADEREGGIRALLNLGHTFGHALEAETGYGDEILHGEAVALGMIMAFRLSARMGLAPVADADRLEGHLAAMGMPTRLSKQRHWNVERLVHHMAGDKKVKDGKITFVLARGIGKSFLTPEVPQQAVHDMLAEFIGA
ncbi:3-dehydroquinate synthase [Magnetospirillum gryphiswaldense]|uniref:3-dehydroquinate synthase n=1 Tax=Magnetospirillum gryphiswaldense TaxID=55518 RepID=A4U0Y5_9PROT|nr:3-dehydroquinate synthase [Magnetospirillum gryphiswaldense]AVM75500.1 3-dehydroquinate synthase [Magnetospirillum gryphiswaldense MSR-1]AVM79403.1 3-dehydroquinate synthase [Magnetospirillum gryphiswaldense]CAM76542.1 3-dehydroquinate synthase [Magnetospirillum gryphiswaldense MSR-1]